MSIGPNAARAFSASARHSRSVRAGSWKTNIFCRKTGERRPGAENEMPLQQRAGGAKLLERLFGGEFMRIGHAAFLAGGGEGAKALREGARATQARRRCARRTPAHAALKPNLSAETPDAVAPDGTAVRLLLCARAAAASPISNSPPAPFRTRSRTGPSRKSGISSPARGEVWRRQGEIESVVAVGPGVSLTIPLGAHFQFRADAAAPLAFVAATMPPWPGDGEAFRVEGRWTAHGVLIRLLPRARSADSQIGAAGLAQLVEQLICNQ